MEVTHPLRDHRQLVQRWVVDHGAKAAAGVDHEAETREAEVVGLEAGVDRRREVVQGVDPEASADRQVSWIPRLFFVAARRHFS